MTNGNEKEHIIIFGDMWTGNFDYSLSVPNFFH